jgi:hypothetical protein
VKPLRTRLEAARKRLGLPWEALERDYLLAWILAGIDRVPVLRDTLVFKGPPANPLLEPMRIPSQDPLVVATLCSYNGQHVHLG